MRKNRSALWISLFSGCFALSGCASVKPALPDESAPAVAYQPDDRTTAPVTPDSAGATQSDPNDVQTAPDTPLSKLSRARASGDTASAEALAAEIIESAPVSPDAVLARAAMAEIAMARGDLDLAILYAEDALEIDESASEIWLILARLRHAREQDGAAVAALNRAIGLNHALAPAYRLRAQILLSYLDLDRALSSAQKAYDLDKNDCKTQIVRADALYAVKNYQDAIAAYESASDACMQNEAILKNMAKIYEVRVANPEKACLTYQKLADLDPNNADYKASRDYQCQTPAAQ